MNKPKPVAQVVAVYPDGPDGHGVNWLTRNRPKPGDLLYLAKDVSQEQTTIISENMRRTIEQALTGAEADADNVPIWWAPDLECLLNELIGKPFKHCATCGYVGHEDPVKGCPSCGFDDMRAKAAEHRDGRLAALEEVAALKLALTALLNDPAVIEAAQPGDIGRALCAVRGI
jgi:hypothetical protein